MKNLLNVAFFIVVLLIFFFLLNTTDVREAFTPALSPVSNTVFVSPSNITYADNIPVIPAVLRKSPSVISNDENIPFGKHHWRSGRVSPQSNDGEASLFDVNVNYGGVTTPKLQEIEKIDYKFSIDGRKFRSLGEQLCCKVIEEYLGRKVLNNIRPNFMKNPKTGRNLELDVYDPCSRIAVEYNGIQHGDDDDDDEGKDEAFTGFGMSEQQFNDQKYRDRLKPFLCKNEGVKLFVVSYKVDSNVRVTYDKTGKQIKKYSYPTASEREKRIYNYLIPRIEEYFNEPI